MQNGGDLLPVENDGLYEAQSQRDACRTPGHRKDISTMKPIKGRCFEEKKRMRGKEGEKQEE